MITLAVNTDNSIYVDSTGNLAVISGKEALAQTLAQISRTRRGEMVYNVQDGVPFMETVFQIRDPLQFEAAMRAEFMKHPEVTGVLSFDMTQEGNEVKYSAQVDSIYGTVEVNG